MTPASATLLLPASLVAPGWLGADRLAEAASLPGWSGLARRATEAETVGPDDPPPSDPGQSRWLCRRLGLPPGTALAACSAWADGEPGAAWRVDPVHLHVGRDHLVLTDPAGLALSADEARALADAIAPLFSEDGMALRAPTPARWYLHEAEGAPPLRLRTRPSEGAVGRNIDAWLPGGDDARRWRRVVNEVQMTWHAHPVNARREADGLPSVNSLWIEGRLPAPAALPGPRRDAAARIACRPPGAPPARFDLGDGTLTIDERLLAAQVAGDPVRWLDAWRALDADTFGPMARGDAGTASRLVLAGDAGWRALDLARRPDWRFWRRHDAAALLAEPGAA